MTHRFSVIENIESVSSAVPKSRYIWTRGAGRRHTTAATQSATLDLHPV